MSRHDVVIVKDTHRGLLYEDGIFRDALPAGRYHIPRQPSRLASFFGASATRAEVVLVDIRWRDRTVVVQDFLTADGVTISATFAIQYRVVDARAALHEAKNFEERAFAETQAAARRVLRGLSLEEILGSRDEIGEELLRQVGESAISFGLEISMLDVKDLVIPADLRAMMNRSVVAGRLRRANLDESAEVRDAPEFDDEPDMEEDADLIDARSTFGLTVPDHLTIRRPEGHAHPGQKRAVTGFDPALRRYRS